MKKVLVTLFALLAYLTLTAETTPDWYDNPATLLGKKVKYFKIGTGDAVSLQRSMAINKAKLEAYASLQEQVKTSITALKKKATAEITEGNDTSENRQLIENASVGAESKAGGIIRNFQVLKQKTMKEGRKYYAYVAIAMPDTVAQSLFMDELKGSTAKIKASKSIEAMEIQLKEYTKVLQNNDE